MKKLRLGERGRDPSKTTGLGARVKLEIGFAQAFSSGEFALQTPVPG